MRRHINKLIYLVPLLMLIAGCGVKDGVDVKITNFEPLQSEALKSSVGKNGETFYYLDKQQYRIETVLYQYDNIIAAFLEINNKSGETISNDKYSVSMHDGRDMKKIKMLTREDLVLTKSRISGHSGGGSLQDQLIESTVQTLSGLVSAPSKQKLLEVVNYAIDYYFDFRPVYPGQKRGGVLCYLVDFRLEYPLTLKVVVEGEENLLQFIPATKPAQAAD